MAGKSNARSTIESGIIDGLSKHANITGASIRHADIQTTDIIESLFHPSTVWAVREYLKEIDEYRDEKRDKMPVKIILKYKYKEKETRETCEVSLANLFHVKQLLKNVFNIEWGKEERDDD